MDLIIDDEGTGHWWYGNNLRENVDGIDDGYSHHYVIGGEILAVRDGTNNLEVVFIPAGRFPSGQRLILRVRGHQVTQGSQKFSLYAYNVRFGS